MKFNYHKQLFIKRKVGYGFFRKPSARYLYFTLVTAVFIIKLTGCEDNNRFYRPNLPEKLCSIGIIDIDDTVNYNSYPDDVRNSARYISFEKSYQAEYPEELNDSLRELSFSISSSDKELFNFRSDTAIKSILGFELPADIEFRTGEKYYLRASEKSTPEISAEVTVPEPPSELTLISVNKEITTLSEPTECIGYTNVKTAVIEFSFENISRQKSFYAILLEGDGGNVSSLFPIQKSQLEFAIRDCNTEGFFAVFPGYTMYQWRCLDDRPSVIKVPIYACFIDGSKIPDNKCIVKITTQFEDERSLFDVIRSFRIKLLSIPEELYLFEKSLYTYGKVYKDPFSEPVYLNGNIQGGNGVFAICRSSELIIDLSPWY